MCVCHRMSSGRHRGLPQLYPNRGIYTSTVPLFASQKSSSDSLWRYQFYQVEVLLYMGKIDDKDGISVYFRGFEIGVRTYFCPSVAQGAMSDENISVFVFAPRGFIDVWIQVVVPALSTLLSYTPRKMAGYCRPLSWPYSTHQFRYLLILLKCSVKLYGEYN